VVQEEKEEAAAAQAADGSKESKDPSEGGEEVPAFERQEAPFEEHTEEEWNV